MTKRKSTPRTRQLVAPPAPRTSARRKAGARAAGAAPAAGRTLYLIRRVQFAAYLGLEDALRPFGLTVAQYMVMSRLGHRGRLSSAQLSRRFSVTPQTMFKLMASLRRKGLIARKGTARDRRALEVRLTAAGRRLLASCEAAVDALEADMFRGFTAKELRAFRGHMVRFLEAKGNGR